MAELSPRLEGPAIADGLTEDRWLGGRLTLIQPRRGHRVGTDAALLVAAAGARQGRIVDVGAGVGAVGLALAKRSALASVDLVEIDPELARLAESNAARNGLQARARVLRLDALNPRERLEAGLLDEAAECVVTNPPFFEAKAVRASPDEGRARAHVLPRAEAGAALAQWIQASLAILAPKRAVRDDPPARRAWRDPCRNWEPARRAGAAAGSSDDRGERASSARLRREGLQGPAAPGAGLILHGAEGRLTAEADAIHRGERPIDWGV